jgi:TonB family protein
MHTLPLASAESLLLTYILNALWQVPLIFAAAWLAARASRRAGPAFQHALWTIALFTEVLLPAISASPAQILQTALSWLASLRQTTPVLEPHVTITMGEVHVAAGGFHLPPMLLVIAAILYLAALAFFAIRLAIGLHQTASLRRRAQPVDLTGYARQSYHRYAQLFAVNQALVATSNEIASPITLGIRRPTLLLPEHLDTTLLNEDLDAALAHEFAHMRRRDFAKNLAYELLSLPIAFHPVLWLTRARMAETRELVCDSMAANAVAGPQRYARSLLRLATQFSQRPQATTPHAIGIFDAHPFKNFERRVMNLTHHPIQLRGAARLVPTALSFALIGAACTSALAFRQQVAAPQTQTTTAPTAVNIDTPPGDQGAPSTVNLAVPRSDLKNAPSVVNIGPAPTGTAPSTVTFSFPRPTVGQPTPSSKVDIADASTPNPVVNIGAPVVMEPTQADAGRTLRISPGVIAGQRITFAEPVYPEDAKKAKLSGTVVLHAIIDKDGSIKTLEVLSSTNPMFNNSALEAVHKWTYKPYLLNGDPTAVDTTITVNYALTPSPTPEPSPAPNPSASNLQSSANQLMHVGGDVKPPIVISRVDPEFSQQAKAAKFSGDVRVYLQVDTDGHTSHIRVVKGVGMGLDEKAVECVSQYRFKPATLNGKSVPVDLYIDVNFQML